MQWGKQIERDIESTHIHSQSRFGQSRSQQQTLQFVLIQKPRSILLPLPSLSLPFLSFRLIRPEELGLIKQRILSLVNGLSHKLVVVSQQQIVLLLELALGAAKGADGSVVDVGEGAADGAVAVGVALVIETVRSEE